MEFDFPNINQSIANSASIVAKINHQNEELLNSVAQANQERIEREQRMVAGAEASIAQKAILEQQVEVMQNQNLLLEENYSKLKEMFDAQTQANKEAKEELKRSKQFNLAMMVISVIAMLAAIAGPIVTIIVSK